MKKAILILSVVVMTAMMLSSCGEGTSNEVTIGSQVWMSENLNVDKFRNGDPIPEAKTDEEWEKAGQNGQPAWCYYDNDPANGAKYGKLYNWYAVNDPRGLAPEGWEIPSDGDWTRLTDFLGGESVAGKKLKSTEFWADNDGESGNGTNESGFSGLPGGYRSNVFSSVGDLVLWWSSTEENAFYAWTRYVQSNNGNVTRSFNHKTFGFYVRCLRGSSPVLEEEKSKYEEELSSDSRYPNIENSNISLKCHWCNDDVSLIESFRNDGYKIYRLMDESGELEYLEELLGAEDEDEFNTLKITYSVLYGGHFYCSRKCASHYDD